MREAVEKEFAALRREARLVKEGLVVHYEARIDNLEKRVTRDIEEDQRRIDGLREELKSAIDENTTRIAALERGEAGTSAVGQEREKIVSRIDAYKLAILGAAVTLAVAFFVFVANFLTAG